MANQHHTLRHAVALCLAMALACLAMAHDTPKYEVRAAWLTTIGGLDWPHSYSQSEASARKQQRELQATLDRLKRANVNTVLLQTRIRATTIYPSALEPWDGCLSGFPGRSPGYDALEYAIEQCHLRGMELHAWVVAMPVGKWNALGCQRLRKRHPKMIRKIGAEGYMDPESAETANYLALLCREIVENYDVDGIHLDYIRYPETWPAKVQGERGRANITRIVKRVHSAVKTLKPWVKMSCSPIGKHDDLPLHWSHGWNARTRVGQDAQAWLRDDLMDELFPMMYFKGEQFYPFALDWKENSYGRIVAPGLGVYMMAPQENDWPLETIEREMRALRQYGMGHAYFRTKFFNDNTKGIYDLTRDLIDTYPALQPPMTWLSTNKPTAPSFISVERRQGGDIVSWGQANDRSYGPYLVYHVYASTEWPVDTSDPRLLVATSLRKQSLSVPRNGDKRQWHYAVTAADRYGTEGPAATTPCPEGERTAPQQQSAWMANDGQRLALPPRPSTLDADIVAVESMAGTLVSTHTWGTTIGIGSLPEGVYTLKSLGRKGATHRIGRFIIRRQWKK